MEQEIDMDTITEFAGIVDKNSVKIRARKYRPTVTVLLPHPVNTALVGFSDDPKVIGYRISIGVIRKGDKYGN